MKHITLFTYLGSAALLGVIALVAINNSITAQDTHVALQSNAIEVTYKATSPIGKSGGTILPASCESNAWNANGGYHLDGVTADPGNCAAVVPPVCNAAKGTACNSTANTCGMTNPGVIACDGSCSVTAPSDASCPPVCNAAKGAACNSTANTCGMTGTGTIECDGSCNAVALSNTSCPAPTGFCAIALNKKELPAKPSAGLCDKGASPSVVTGTGADSNPWKWTCTEAPIAVQNQVNTKISQLAQVSSAKPVDGGCGIRNTGVGCRDADFIDNNEGGGIWDTIVEVVINPVITVLNPVVAPIVEIISPVVAPIIETIIPRASPAAQTTTPAPAAITSRALVTETCTATIVDSVDDKPTVPIIGGTTRISVNASTANTIVATDPEGDQLYYEIDWNGNGSVDGTTAPSTSGTVSQIGHMYNTIGTYNIKGRAVEVNGKKQKSAWANYTIQVVNSQCTQRNACGLIYVKDSSGSCVSQPLPVGYGEYCSSPANSCGKTALGYTTCSGDCSAEIPSNATCPGACESLANNCGEKNIGTLVLGVCNASKPADRASCITASTTKKVKINSFEATPRIVLKNKATTLSWSIKNPKNCDIFYTNVSGGGSVKVYDVTSEEGSYSTSELNEDRVYTLSCGTEERSITVEVFWINEFRVSPKIIAKGKDARLYWDMVGPTNAPGENTCQIIYTTLSNSSPTVESSSITARVGNKLQERVLEKRYYTLQCTLDSRKLDLNVYSLTEI